MYAKEGTGTTPCLRATRLRIQGLVSVPGLPHPLDLLPRLTHCLHTASEEISILSN